MVGAGPGVGHGQRVVELPALRGRVGRRGHRQLHVGRRAAVRRAERRPEPARTGSTRASAGCSRGRLFAARRARPDRTVPLPEGARNRPSAMASGPLVRRTAIRPTPSVARFQNFDVNTCRSLPETAGARLRRRGGTPAATPKILRELFNAKNFPLYPQHLTLLSQPVGQIVGFALCVVKQSRRCHSLNESLRYRGFFRLTVLWRDPEKRRVSSPSTRVQVPSGPRTQPALVSDRLTARISSSRAASAASSTGHSS